MTEFPYSEEWKHIEVGEIFPSMKSLFEKFGVTAKRYETYRKRVENYVEFSNVPGSRKVVVEKVYLEGKEEVLPSKKSIDTMLFTLYKKTFEQEEQVLMSKTALAMTLGLSSKSLNTFLFDGRGVVLEEGVSESDVEKFYERYYNPILNKFLKSLPIDKVYSTKVLSTEYLKEIRVCQDSIEEVKRYSYSLEILDKEKEEVFEEVKSEVLLEFGVENAFDIIQTGQWNLFVEQVNNILVSNYGFVYPTKEFLLKKENFMVEGLKPDFKLLKNEFKRAIVENRKIKEPLNDKVLRKLCDWI